MASSGRGAVYQFLALMNLLFDAPDQEFWMDETNRGNSVVPALSNAYAWVVTDHRVAFSEPYLMSHGNPYGKDSFPPHEVLRRMMLALTYGCGPSVAVSQPARLQAELYECLGEVQKRKPWLTRKRPEPWAALLMSDNTRVLYGRDPGNVEDRYLAAVLGTFRACVEEHLPVAVVNDWNLNPEDLARYKMLLLPNAACLDDRQAEAVRGFVKNGGGLVASLDASLFDGFGTPRDNFALADVFGADYRGRIEPGPLPKDVDVNFAGAIGPDYWEKRKGVFDFRQAGRGVVPEPGPDEDVRGRRPGDVQGAGRAGRAPRRRDGGRDGAGEGRGRRPGPARGGGARVREGAGGVLPGGAGRGVLPVPVPVPATGGGARGPVGGVGSAASGVGGHDVCPRHGGAAGEGRRAAGRPPVQRPGHQWRPRPPGRRRAAAGGGCAGRGRAGTFRADYKLRRVRLEPAGRALAVRESDRGSEVVVPRLAVHAMVVAELGDGTGR